MSAGVFTPNYRFVFIEKVIGDVGDGTEFPLEVTLDQLAEIMYRVKDCKFTTGETIIQFTDEFSDTNLTTLSFNFGDPDPSLYSGPNGFGNSVMVRAYCTSIQDDYGSPPTEPMQAWSQYFSETYTRAGVTEDVRVRDAVPEYAIWARATAPDANPSTYDSYVLMYPFGPYIIPLPDIGFRTGFSFLAYDGVDEELAGYPTCQSEFTFAGGSECYLNFTGQVAWVDVSGSGNPADPANRIFIGMTFAQGGDPVVVSTRATELPAVYPAEASPSLTGSLFELELSEGVVVSCPLYWYPVFAAAGGQVLYSATNYRIKATEWWPYAKGSPATPVWDSSDGTKL